MNQVYQILLEKLHNGTSPYHGFPADQWAGTWYNDPGARRTFFNDALDKASPGLVIEVGSFVGESAIHMAEHLSLCRHDWAILCVDTWMGGIDHWEKVPEKLKFHFGRPSLYYQFIGNVIKSGYQNHILPLSLDSMNAARLLKMKGVKADMIYVDASHEEEDALRDYRAYWDLVRPGGAFLVDDLTGWFRGVVSAFDKFCKEVGKDPVIDGEKGLLIR